MNTPYSILFGRARVGFPCVRHRLAELVSPDDKVTIIPWSMIYEDHGYIETEAYFPRYGERYEREMYCLRALGLKDENVYIADCYAHPAEKIQSEIETSDIVVLPGGNPVMLKEKICGLGLDGTLRKYQNIIIGGSAGATTQFEKYFITEEQNGPRGFQECEGIGILHVDFMIDVHTDCYTTGEYEYNKEKYYAVLRMLAVQYQKKILGICDDGAILVNRENGSFETFGNVVSFSYQMI